MGNGFLVKSKCFIFLHGRSCNCLPWPNFSLNSGQSDLALERTGAKLRGVTISSLCTWQASVLERTSRGSSTAISSCADAFNYQVQQTALTRGGTEKATCMAPPAGHFYPMPECAPWVPACCFNSVLTPIFVMFIYLDSFFFFCIFLGLESCPQLKLDRDWTCCVALTSPSPRASSCTLCFQYVAWMLSFCLHSGACRKVFIQSVGPSPYLMAATLGRQYLYISVWPISCFSMDHRWWLFLFKALPKANHLPLKQEETYYI